MDLDLYEYTIKSHLTLSKFFLSLNVIYGGELWPTNGGELWPTNGGLSFGVISRVTNIRR